MALREETITTVPQRPGDYSRFYWPGIAGLFFGPPVGFVEHIDARRLSVANAR
jgi:hypothetical protein